MAHVIHQTSECRKEPDKTKGHGNTNKHTLSIQDRPNSWTRKTLSGEKAEIREEWEMWIMGSFLTMPLHTWMWNQTAQ